MEMYTYTQLQQLLLHYISPWIVHAHKATLAVDLSLSRLCFPDFKKTTQTGAVGEFVKYAIRQQSKKEMARSPVTVGNLLTQLQRLARHPNR
jgi:hypothetical protein